MLFALLGLVAGGYKLVQTRTVKELEGTVEDKQSSDPSTIQQRNDEMMAAIAGAYALRSMGRPAPLKVFLLPDFTDGCTKMQRLDLPMAPPDPFVQEVAVGDSSVPTDEEWDTLSNLAPVVPIGSRQVIPGRTTPPRHLRATGTNTHLPVLQQP